jgi:hypothetical protein
MEPAKSAALEQKNAATLVGGGGFDVVKRPAERRA